MTTLEFPEFLSAENLGQLSAFAELRSGMLHVEGMTPASSAMMVADRFCKFPQSILVVVDDYRTGEVWMQNLQSLCGDKNVHFFPSLGLKPYEAKVPFAGILEERLKFFKASQGKLPFIAVCPLDSLLLRLPEPSLLEKQKIVFRKGDVIDPLSLRKTLGDMGYTEQPVVSTVGEFSIRGCIVDINLYMQEHPVRLEFFGDEIESIRSFDIFSQRSIDQLNSVEVYPHGEFNLSVEEKAKIPVEEEELVWWRRPEYETLKSTVLDYMPDAAIVFDGLSVLEESAGKLGALHVKSYEKAISLQQKVAPPTDLWYRFDIFESEFSKRIVLDFTRARMESPDWISIAVRQQTKGVSGTSGLVKEIEGFYAQGGLVYLVAHSEGSAQRVQHLFDGAPVAGILIGDLSDGFWIESDNIAFLTEAEIFNRTGKVRRKHAVSGSISDALLVESLTRGDFVVHEDHGIGRYMGLVREKINGGLVDCIQLDYADGDRLKFPVSDLRKIEKLPSSEEETVPELAHLGSKSWEKLKERVKKRVIKIARELVQLYAKRELIEGFAFPPDSRMQKEFEDAFEYEPTPDQVRATKEIKEDMENNRPMDRLVCGDVGFGKTEVAMRAAFKCVYSKKQVAVLVPTTILAAQHYETFKERFAAFPVNIALVNRYKTAGEKKKIFKEVSEGKYDIVVGTHALLSNQSAFKDLGLLIIDEEQKFGVKQKEHLRELRLTVDTLSMSATPIPRSLHLSLTGVRDISLINTPPMNRLPVETKILQRDDTVLAEAIHDELARGGQVFVVNDRVQSIEHLAEDIEAMAPGARVAVAHGQMEDHDLERVMDAFIKGDFDILVSTSIIESGLDVPNANTILIMNAHHFGISQLYQMRGRVGRSDVLAYAYLVIPKNEMISAESTKRLQALEQFTDLGSGYQLAMRDLEIRGAGNLLGSEQHGFIAEVGFETYVRLVREAVEELRGGGEESSKVQPRVELSIDAFLPETYITDGLSRISIYQRLARTSKLEDLPPLFAELEDRFGPAPDAVKKLFLVTEVAMIAAKLRIQGIEARRGMLVFTFMEFPPPDPKMLAELAAVSPFGMRYVGNSPLQGAVELGRAISDDEAAAAALKLFRAFASVIPDKPAEAPKPLPKMPTIAISESAPSPKKKG
ncbi:MAG: transcription-repair coupling factor [Hallerella sp.]|jgi:transcription-repair coupling factor (superfamily II helicase)|nr:transcription-repair coupling factor [Fibrobacter sp.]MDY6369233.1 transcription-repair coupling factor [Fibrobacter sp.]MDY6389660.1 transcription-repair coupling factor [Fibrobacter sp.]MEE3339786.1 transcription-repair coupling factor [Hallerella sp.]